MSEAICSNEQGPKAAGPLLDHTGLLDSQAEEDGDQESQSGSEGCWPQGTCLKHLLVDVVAQMLTTKLEWNRYSFPVRYPACILCSFCVSSSATSAGARAEETSVQDNPRQVCPGALRDLCYHTGRILSGVSQHTNHTHYTSWFCVYETALCRSLSLIIV